MKKVFLYMLIMGISFGAFAQQVTSESKLTAMPEYVNAQREISLLSIQWQKEIETRYSEIRILTEEYNANATGLSENTKKDRQNVIAQKRQEVINLQRQHFGINGDLYKKREVLLRPLQEKLIKEEESSY